MGAFLSIPFMSFLLIPALSSYTTTLNLLFFYMTWSTLVWSHSPLRVEIFGTAAFRLAFFVVPSLVFFLFDVLTPSAAVVVKAHGEAGLPGGRKRFKLRSKEFKIAGWSLFNLGLALFTQATLEWLFTRVLRMRSAIKVSVSLPTPWTMLQDIFFGFLFREGLTYASHRYALHHPRSFLTKLHQEWYHDLSLPFPLTAHYDHPLVYLAHRFVPTYLPVMLLRFHMITFLLYTAAVSIEETFAYSGYTFMPTSFFLGGIARRNEEHIIYSGEGNFGPWGILDWILGTSIGATDIEDDLRNEARDHHLGQKVRQAMDANNRKVHVDTLRRNGRKR
ncbi:Sterol desaturase family [Penicillium brasilianum]|uniref:Sterol desaturase family n=1 Tax=Penicillium brasilianum TaxID=104259 RepID=A0A1S9RG27_PENBI|nr:Sterol desaturase family [Penicillium brasilianum]